MPKARKVILAIVVVFCLYAVLKYPTQSANSVSNFFDVIAGALKSIGTFFSNIISG